MAHHPQHPDILCHLKDTYNHEVVTPLVDFGGAPGLGGRIIRSNSPNILRETMTTFSGRKFVQVLATTLALLGIVACNNEEATNGNGNDNGGAPNLPSGSIVFKCVEQGGNPTTIVEVANAAQSPVINWNTTEFGPQWTPSQRCQTVSSKLTKAVADNGGDLNGLDLNTGKVSDYIVVCVLNSGERTCDSSNMVMTLNKQNAKNPSALLRKINNLDPANPPSPIAE